MKLISDAVKKIITYIKRKSRASKSGASKATTWCQSKGRWKKFDKELTQTTTPVDTVGVLLENPSRYQKH